SKSSTTARYSAAVFGVDAGAVISSITLSSPLISGCVPTMVISSRLLLCLHGTGGTDGCQLNATGGLYSRQACILLRELCCAWRACPWPVQALFNPALNRRS